jgi:transcriptional regulator with XRE-family HTH domain
MRKSPLRHTLAVLRVKLNLRQKEMADLVGCSTSTIQAIELKKLPLKEELAGRIAFHTGVSIGWLLDNDVNRPPVNGNGEAYTVEKYRDERGRLIKPAQNYRNMCQDLFTARGTVWGSLEILTALSKRAYQNNTLPAFTLKVVEALKPLLADLDPKEHADLAERYKNISRQDAIGVEDITGPIRRFVSETGDIFQKRSTGSKPLEFHKKPVSAPRPVINIQYTDHKPSRLRRARRPPSAPPFYPGPLARWI